MARIAFLVDQTMITPSGIIPSLVKENQPGHYPTTFLWGHDMTIAKAMARDANRDMGHTPADVAVIIASSFAASRMTD